VHHLCLVAVGCVLCPVDLGRVGGVGKRYLKENADDGQFQPIATTGTHSIHCLSLSLPSPTPPSLSSFSTM